MTLKDCAPNEAVAILARLMLMMIACKSEELGIEINDDTDVDLFNKCLKDISIVRDYLDSVNSTEEVASAVISTIAAAIENDVDL